MPRSRRSRSASEGSSVTSNEPQTERKYKVMAGLSPEQITALLSKTRQKGLYTDKLNEFVGMELAGVDVGEQWIEFQGKKGSTLKQGFDSAKEKKEAAPGTDQVKVVSQKGEDGSEHVYLINLALAQADADA